jgi:hypothetical protein
LAFPFDESHTLVKLLEQICTQCAALLSHVELLEMSGDALYFVLWRWTCDALWLEFLRPFTAVQTLRLAGDDFLPYLARILGALTGERATQVLPALRTILLLDLPSEEYAHLLKPFIVAREHSEHPVVVKYPG